MTFEVEPLAIRRRSLLPMPRVTPLDGPVAVTGASGYVGRLLRSLGPARVRADLGH